MTRAQDIEANRKAKKWTLKEQAGRVIWGMMRPLFAFSPRPLWGWRRFLLRLAGAKIGRDVHLHPSVQVPIPWNITIGDHTGVGDRAILYALGSITIGPRATISQLAHLCAGTHDWRDPSMPLVKPPIEIGADAWVCADAFIGPNVTIGERAIIGARAVVTKDVAPGVIVAGNPACKIGERTP